MQYFHYWHKYTAGRVVVILLGLFIGGVSLNLQAQGHLPVHKLGTNEGLSESMNIFMHRASNGLMYISSLDGTNIYDGHTVQVFREGLMAEEGHHYLGKTNLGPFLEASNGDIWFSTEKAIVCHRQNDGFFYSYQIDSTLKSTQYYAFAIEQDSYLWVVFNEQLYRLDIRKTSSISSATPIANMSFMNGEVRKDAEGRVFEVWGSFWRLPGLVRLQIDQLGNTGTVDTIKQLPNGESTPELMSWEKDESGNLYVTSYQKLYIFPKNNQSAFKAIDLPPNTNIVFGMTWRAPGRLWLISPTGLLEYNGGNSIRTLTSKETGIPSNLLNGHSLYVDQDIPNQREMFWLGKNGYPLEYGNLLGNIFDNYLKELPLNERQPIFLTLDRKGNLITKTQAGLLAFNENGIQIKADSTGEIIKINNQLFKIDIERPWQLSGYDALKKKWILQTSAPMSSILKIAKTDSLLAIISTRGTISFFQVGTKTDNFGNIKLDSVYTSSDLGPISDVAYDNKRKVLWAVSSTGLHAIDPVKQNDKHYTTKDGLPVENLRSLVLDKKNRLWISSTKGIFDFVPERAPRSTFHLTAEDGLSSNEFLRKMATVTTDGRLAFGSTNGIDVFHPDSLRNPHLPARAMFRRLKIHGKDWVGPKTIDRTEAIELPYNQNALTLGFAAPNFAAPKRTEFRLITQIDGEKSDTAYLGTTDEITLPNLAPANYRFGLMARAKGNPNFDPPKWLSVTITPHWTGTLWFRALVIIGSLLFVGSLIRARYSYQLSLQEAKAAEERLLASQREARLQRKIDLEDQRRRITSRMHNDIGGSLTTLSMLSSRLSRTKDVEKASEISQKISHWAKDLRRRVSSFLRVMNPNFDNLERLAGVLRTYAADVLTDNGLEAEFDFPADYPSYELTPDFSIATLEITQEIINNILKYASASKVNMRFAVNSEEVHITIQDDGIGFNPSAEDFKKGIGLSSLKSLAEKFGGNLSYQPGPENKGTVVNCNLIVAHWQGEKHAQHPQNVKS